MSTTTTNTQMERDTLLHIRQLVELTHWTKGNYHTMFEGKPLFCLVGMVNSRYADVEIDLDSTSWGGHSRQLVIEALKDAIDSYEQRYGRSLDDDTIELWNDAAARTRQEVLDVIEMALEQHS